MLVSKNITDAKPYEEYIITEISSILKQVFGCKVGTTQQELETLSLVFM